jgi:hypothetical protein
MTAKKKKVADNKRQITILKNKIVKLQDLVDASTKQLIEAANKLTAICPHTKSEIRVEGITYVTVCGVCGKKLGKEISFHKEGQSQ